MFYGDNSEHFCSICGNRADFDEDMHEFQDHWYCRRKEIVKRAKAVRAEKLSKGALAPFYVALYAVNQCYGGPEEGGWWYDWHSLEDIYKVWDIESALKKCRELREEYETTRKPQRSNVNGGPDYYFRVVYTPEHAEEYTTKQRPYYC